MAEKRPKSYKVSLAGHVASKFPKFTRKQAFALVVLALLVGGAGAGVYHASKGSRPEQSGADNRPPQSQQIVGNNNIQLGIAGDVTINSQPKIRATSVLQNAGSNVVLILKDIDEVPKMLILYANDEDKRLGFVPVGTEVKVLPVKRKSSKSPTLASYTLVELLAGEYKGQVGWVSVSNIRSEAVTE